MLCFVYRRKSCSVWALENLGEQLEIVKKSTENPCVAGSIPASATNFFAPGEKIVSPKREARRRTLEPQSFALLFKRWSWSDHHERQTVSFRLPKNRLFAG